MPPAPKAPTHAHAHHPDVLDLPEGPTLAVTVKARNGDVLVTVPLADVRAVLDSYDVSNGISFGFTARRAMAEACVTHPKRSREPSSCRCQTHTADRTRTAAADARGCRVCALIRGAVPVGQVEELQARFLESLDLVDLAAVHAFCPDRNL